MRGSWKIREWQKAKERQTLSGTQWLDNTTHPNMPDEPQRHPTVPASLYPHVLVLTHTLSPLLVCWPLWSQTHTISLILNTHVAAGHSGNLICTTSPRLLNSTLLSVSTRHMFLPLGESQNWENNKELHCMFLSGCEAFWVLITQRVLCTAEPHSTPIWWTSNVETLHTDCWN